MKQTKFLLSWYIILALIVGCASFKQNTYQTLSFSSQTYDTILSIIGDLYKQGKVTEDQKKEIINLGHIYKDSHNAAVEALLRYEESESLSDQEIYLQHLSNASIFLADLLYYVQPIIEGGKD